MYDLCKAVDYRLIRKDTLLDMAQLDIINSGSNICIAIKTASEYSQVKTLILD